MENKLKQLMTKINEFLFENQNFGIDKVLHFFVGAWFVAEFKIYGVIPMMVSWFIIIIILSFIKEKYMDKNFDARDLFFGVAGGFLSILLYIPYDLLFG